MTSTPPTSRVIVKNLPKWATDTQIRKHFSAKGQITDIKLMYTRSGVFRRFAYVGFASADDAAAAVRFFDRTFMDTMRIVVEFAYRADSQELSRPWSKYSQGSSANQAHLKSKEEAKLEAKAEKPLDPAQEELERKKRLLASICGEEESSLKAFVNAAKPTSKTKVWENDTADAAFTAPEKAKKGQLKTAPIKKMLSAEDGSESDDLYEDFTAEKQLQSGDEEAPMPESLEESRGNVIHAQAPEPFDSTPHDLIADTGRLFIRNLSYSCTEEELKKIFEPFGPIVEVHLSISRDTKKPKGFAYVMFMFPEHALRAYSELDGIIFQGRIMHILPAHEKPQPKLKDEENGGYQAKKAEEQKATAQKDYNWNSLFIRSDTVLDAIAAKLGVTKSSIMDVASENLATKLAVAETNLIHEVKSYLETEGVVLDAFVAGFERSNTVILVKNLPFDCELAEIRRSFEKFGSLGRVILPPTKAVALVEFLEAAEARAAFRALAYSKFKHVPLFLEWAPVKALKPGKPGAIIAEPVKITDDSNVAEEDPSLTSASTLYVKNLNFSTTSDTLKTVFSAMGSVRSAKVATKKSGDKVLSLGFGFVEFERKESLNRALDELQGHVVDGHALLLKKSTSRADSHEKENRRKKTANVTPDEENEQNTKIIVRNIPFEASAKEVRDLFKTFAQLKRVRLPLRHDNRHRGFGFVEFLTHQEAVNARQTLAHTHLYGRHLVLEWAKPESEETQLEELRDRTKRRMNVSTNSGSASGKKLRLDENDPDVLQIADSDDE